MNRIRASKKTILLLTFNRNIIVEEFYLFNCLAVAEEQPQVQELAQLKAAEQLQVATKERAATVQRVVQQAHR